MKIGDNVRFLDSVGGGKVTGFQGRDIVLVEDQDGFDIPVLVRNCVVVDTEKEKIITGETYAPKTQTKHSDNTPQPEPEEIEPADRPITYRPITQERKGGDKLNLYLCFEPEATQQPSTASSLAKSKFDVYFINDSNYYVNYTFLSGEGSIWMMRHIDTAEPNTKIFVETIDTDTLNELQHICLQAMAFKQDRTFMLKAPVSVETRLDLTRFYKPHLFRPNEFFTTPVLTIPMVKDDIAVSDPRKMQLTKITLGNTSTDATAQQSTATKPKADPKQDEVIDLHASELLDTTAGMTPGDILDYQIDTFRKKMDEYIKIKGKRIVFIHGKGDGILRNKIIQQLKRHYPRCNWQDASFREYGFGATLVIIH